MINSKKLLLLLLLSVQVSTFSDEDSLLYQYTNQGIDNIIKTIEYLNDELDSRITRFPKNRNSKYIFEKKDNYHTLTINEVLTPNISNESYKRFGNIGDENILSYDDNEYLYTSTVAEIFKHLLELEFIEVYNNNNLGLILYYKSQFRFEDISFRSFKDLNYCYIKVKFHNKKNGIVGVNYLLQNGYKIKVKELENRRVIQFSADMRIPNYQVTKYEDLSKLCGQKKHPSFNNFSIELIGEKALPNINNRLIEHIISPIKPKKGKSIYIAKKVDKLPSRSKRVRPPKGSEIMNDRDFVRAYNIIMNK